jgi:polysaccharide pyruvyl transferase WcaK-like protein
VEKSLFFGLRNYGSINAVRKYLPEYLYDKISYQPCPTTMTSVYSSEIVIPKTKPTNEIAITVAFNQFKNRFNDNWQSLFKQLIKYCQIMEQEGFKIIFCGHHVLDTHNKYIKYFKEYGFLINPLYKYSEHSIYEFYKRKKLVISMRGHGLMIPFGLNVPVLSLTTQDKQKWFIDDTGHNKWNIELTNNLYKDLLNSTLRILNNYEYTRNVIMKIQKVNKEITDKNIQYIKKNI